MQKLRVFSVKYHLLMYKCAECIIVTCAQRCAFKAVSALNHTKKSNTENTFKCVKIYRFLSLYSTYHLCCVAVSLPVALKGVQLLSWRVTKSTKAQYASMT